MYRYLLRQGSVMSSLLCVSFVCFLSICLSFSRTRLPMSLGRGARCDPLVAILIFNEKVAPILGTRGRYSLYII